MAGRRKISGRLLVMQRVWRVGRPVTPNGPGGRRSRRGRATAVEPGRLASQADKRKGFPKASDAAAIRGPCLAAGVRNTHPLYAWRSLPTPTPVAPPCGRARTARDGAGRDSRVPPQPCCARRGRQARSGCADLQELPPGRGRRCLLGNPPPTSRGGSASRHLRQRCHGSRLHAGTLPAVQGDSFDRFTATVSRASVRRCRAHQPAPRRGSTPAASAARPRPGE